MTANEKIDQYVLNMIGQNPRPQPQEEAEPAEPFAWDQPWRFTQDMLQHLREFCKRTGSTLAKHLHEVYNDEHELGDIQLQLRFGEQLKPEAGSDSDYIVSIDIPNGRRIGYVKLPPVLAMTWIERQLGGRAVAQEVHRDLSALESVLMVEATKAAVDVVSESLTESHGQPVAAGDQAYRGDYMLPGEDDTIFVRIELPLVFSEVTLPLVLAIEAEYLAAVCDPSARLRRKQAPAKQRMQGHIERVELGAEVLVGRADVLLRDVMALEAGDVLVLKRECDDPIDLHVEGTQLAKGYPVQVGENYGFQLASFYDQAEIVAGD